MKCAIDLYENSVFVTDLEVIMWCQLIIDLCVSSGLPQPVFYTGFGGLQLEFIQNPETSEKMTEKMTEKILNLIRSNPEITIVMLADQTGRSESTMDRTLRKLQKDKRIVRIGPDKGGYWKVIE